MFDQLHYSVGEANEDLKEFRDLNNELNKLSEGKQKIEEYEKLNDKLEAGNLTLEERKELLEDIEKLEIEIAGLVEGSGTSYNEQGEEKIQSAEAAAEVLQSDIDNEILDTAANLQENSIALNKARKDTKNYKEDLQKLREELEDSQYSIMGTGRKTAIIEKDIKKLREEKQMVVEADNGINEAMMH